MTVSESVKYAGKDTAYAKAMQFPWIRLQTSWNSDGTSPAAWSSSLVCKARNTFSVLGKGWHLFSSSTSSRCTRQGDAIPSDSSRKLLEIGWHLFGTFSERGWHLFGIRVAPFLQISNSPSTPSLRGYRFDWPPEPASGPESSNTTRKRLADGAVSLARSSRVEGDAALESRGRIAK